MNPVVAGMEVIMPKEILASKNELPVKLFIHAVRLCVTMINLCKVSADIHIVPVLKILGKVLPFLPLL